MIYKSFAGKSWILALFACTACVAVWGKSYNVALSNSRSVVIEYDPVVIDLPEMLRAAQSACAKYGKDAVLDNVSEGNLKIKVNTYRCERRTSHRTIDVQG